MSANGNGLRVSHLQKSFGGGKVVACEDVDLDVEEGELLVMLGPSGCGKTTTLRCIAGLEHPDNDDAIWIRGHNMTRVPPRDRNLAFVFQHTAMFPNLDVRRNISFGLDVRKQVARPEIDRRVAEAARMLKDRASARPPAARASRAARASGSRLAAPSSPSPTPFCSTSRWRPSTRRSGSRCAPKSS